MRAGLQCQIELLPQEGRRVGRSTARKQNRFPEKTEKGRTPTMITFKCDFLWRIIQWWPLMGKHQWPTSSWLRSSCYRIGHRWPGNCAEEEREEKGFSGTDTLRTYGNSTYYEKNTRIRMYHPFLSFIPADTSAPLDASATPRST